MVTLTGVNFDNEVCINRFLGLINWFTIVVCVVVSELKAKKVFWVRCNFDNKINQKIFVQDFFCDLLDVCGNHPSQLLRGIFLFLTNLASPPKLLKIQDPVSSYLVTSCCCTCTYYLHQATSTTKKLQKSARPPQYSVH